MNKPRRVAVLGATGSIGKSAAAVARALPREIQITGIAAHSNAAELLALADEFSPKIVCLAGGDAGSRNTLMSTQNKHRMVFGEEGLCEVATHPEVDIVLIAIVGTAGLLPALAAIDAGKDIAVASKEILVMAGEIITAAARKKGVKILPVDSEHNAIFQCLQGSDASTVRCLHLTCSGGAFRDLPASELAGVTPEMALRHPTWSMGPKITIDSATLFNKGLEMIEARWLFDVPIDQIEVVIHPQSIVHSLVEFVDGSILAQLSCTDMQFPIQYALTWPERLGGPSARLDLKSMGSLEFFEPRKDDFPALELARKAAKLGGTMPAVLNAANETAVPYFLGRQIPFPWIWKSVEAAMATVPFEAEPNLERILVADRQAREFVAKNFNGGMLETQE